MVLCYMAQLTWKRGYPGGSNLITWSFRRRELYTGGCRWERRISTTRKNWRAFVWRWKGPHEEECGQLLRANHILWLTDSKETGTAISHLQGSELCPHLNESESSFSPTISRQEDSWSTPSRQPVMPWVESRLACPQLLTKKLHGNKWAVR